MQIDDLRMRLERETNELKQKIDELKLQRKWDWDLKSIEMQELADCCQGLETDQKLNKKVTKQKICSNFETRIITSSIFLKVRKI